MSDIAPMTLRDLAGVLDWAAAEGWNPGLDDAAAFYAADPTGFFLKRVDGRPAAALSVVNHSDKFAFLGLYICHPDFRGQGHGVDVWRAGIAYAGRRTIGLDGVPAQQANYEASGFVHAGETTRYTGRLPRAVAGRAFDPDDLPTLLLQDRAASGISRPRYLTPWLAGAATRRTLVLGATGHVEAFATGRRCREGIKIGPLRAATADHALSLIAALGEGDPVSVDVPARAPDLARTLTDAGFTPGFSTARMYRGPAPIGAPQRFEAVTSLELG